MAALRDALVLVAASDDALAHALVCRRARIVQIGLEQYTTPRAAHLAASRALPYEFVRPGSLGEALRAWSR